MPRTSANSRRKRTTALLGDDVFIANQDRFAAVINPTDETVETWAYGRRAVLVPNELDDERRACIQFIDRRLARKMVYNKRRLLEILSFEQGRRLLKQARELNDFQAAYAQLTGRTLSKAAQEIRRRRTLQQLRTQLDNLGIQVRREWDIDTMKKILRNPELAFDVDAGLDGLEEPPASPFERSAIESDRLTAGLRRDDFISPERFDDEPEPESEPEPEEDEREIEPPEQVAQRVAEQDSREVRAAELRSKLRMLGVEVHARTRNVQKLTKMLKEAEAAVAAGVT